MWRVQYGLAKIRTAARTLLTHLRFQKCLLLLVMMFLSLVVDDVAVGVDDAVVGCC